MMGRRVILKSLIMILLAILVYSCGRSDSPTDYLQKVLNELDKIKSVTYYSTGISSAPGDTAKFTEPRTTYIKIFVNPADTLVGAKSAIYSLEDTTRITDFYDGLVRGKFNWDEHYVKIDSFQNHPYPFRLVHYSFYLKTKEIINYALTTKDSIKTELHDYGDSVKFSLSIYNRHVYFHIRPIVIANDYIPEDEISQFDIWFRKSDNMPYRMRSRWHHLTFHEECTVITLNTKNDKKFIATDHFPADFEVVPFVREERTIQNSLEGKAAPEWELKDLSGNTVGLGDLKSRVLMLQFTGVGCGPCHHSIPFLRQLADDYKEKDFELIAIETWIDNIEGLIRYRDLNEINFKFLNADDNITFDYDIRSVPTFFILDENRVIRKVISGYSNDITDKEILTAIDELI